MTSVHTAKEKAYLHRALSRGASYEGPSGRQLCFLSQQMLRPGGLT